MYTVKEFFVRHCDELGLKLIAGKGGISRSIQVPEVERPGLSLAGHIKGQKGKRILIFGKAEIEYLRALSSDERERRLRGLLTPKIPAVIVTRRLQPPREMIRLCEDSHIPLLRADSTTMSLMRHLMFLLADQFAPTLCCHGSLVEVFGVGLLIQGDSAVGKSEAALGLIERGHHLISDDIVRVKKLGKHSLEGCGLELSRHYMEVRGVGIINIANLYGAVCVKEKKSLDIVVKLEVWDDTHFYDRVGCEEKTIPILDVEVPYHILPVKPGRDVVLLLETIALNYRLKKAGYHSAKELNEKLLTTIENRGKKGHGRKKINPKSSCQK